LKDEILPVDITLKKYLSQIATLFGVPHEIVKSVWEYTLIMYFIKLSESPADGKTIDTLTIPYVGNLGIRYKADDDIECFISLNDSFKKEIASLKNGNASDLCDFIENKQLKDLLKVLDETL
jgi:hypothetical protein